MKSIYAYIGYSNDPAFVYDRGGGFCKMPERVLMFFTSINSLEKFQQNFEIKDDNIIRIHNWCSGIMLSRKQVLELVNDLDDECEKQFILCDLDKIDEDVPFVLVVEDRNDYSAKEDEVNENTDTVEAVDDGRYGHKKTVNFTVYSVPFPICNTRFPEHDPEVELGYVRGAFHNSTPFFAKLWKSGKNGRKYVSVIYYTDYWGDDYDFNLRLREENADTDKAALENEVINVLTLSGLEVNGHIQKAKALLDIVSYIGDRGILRYASNQLILNYVCCLCKDKDENRLIAYTTEVTEPYDDNYTGTICNLDFLSYADKYSRDFEIIYKIVEKFKHSDSFQKRFNIVKEEIDEWDLEGLLALGTPKDEYDNESKLITAIIDENSSIEKITEAINYVFNLMFNNEDAQSEKYVEVAKAIKNELDAANSGIINPTARWKLTDDIVDYKFFVADGWVYYLNNNDDRKIYKVRADGTERQIICDVRIRGLINIVDDWLYYSQNGTDANDRLYRIRTDGSEWQKIIDGYNRMEFIGDWIYYSSYNDSNFFRIRTNGTDKYMISEDADIWNFCVVGDWIYYTDSPLGKLFRIRTDGTKKSMITENQTGTFKVHGDWVYYNNYDADSRLYRIRIDGTEIQELTDYYTASVSIKDDWLYCQEYNKDDEYNPYYKGISKMRTDGSEKQLLTDVACDNYIIDATGNWIYYSNDDDGSSLYKMRTDGTEIKKLNNDFSHSIQVVDDWVFYLKRKYNQRIYRIPTYGIDI